MPPQRGSPHRRRGQTRGGSGCPVTVRWVSPSVGRPTDYHPSPTAAGRGRCARRLRRALRRRAGAVGLRPARTTVRPTLDQHPSSAPHRHDSRSGGHKPSGLRPDTPALTPVRQERPTDPSASPTITRTPIGGISSPLNPRSSTKTAASPGGTIPVSVTAAPRPCRPRPAPGFPTPSLKLTSCWRSRHVVRHSLASADPDVSSWDH